MALLVETLTTVTAINRVNVLRIARTRSATSHETTNQIRGLI
jgi:hypothetical protein